VGTRWRLPLPARRLGRKTSMIARLPARSGVPSRGSWTPKTRPPR